MRKYLSFLPVCLCLAAVALSGCGGGGGGGGGDDTAAIPAPGGSGDTQSQYVVVRYDHTGDGNADVLTLDPANEPFTVVEALAGTADGGSVDATPSLTGQAIDPAISDALSAFLADSLEVASETELDAIDSLGNSVTLTVYE